MREHCNRHAHMHSIATNEDGNQIVQCLGDLVPKTNCLLHRDSFHDVARDLSLAAVVEPCRSWVTVSGQLLDVFKWDALE